jgi:antitoxin component YwqK of YwqJK toxin-antitoxin module
MLSFYKFFSADSYLLICEIIIASILLVYFIQSPVLDGEYSGTDIVINNGIIYRCGESSPFTGKVLDTLSNRMILEFDVINGLKNGEFLISTLDGNLTTRGYIENNKNVGTWKYFYENGDIESIGEFFNDKPNGKWTWYYENGVKKSEGIYVNGLQEGKWTKYDESGNLSKIIYYQKGEEVTKTETGRNLNI